MPTSAIPFWNRLSVRLAAVITLVTAATIGIFAWAAVRAYEHQLIDQVVRDAALFSETIKSSTYHDMLADRREDAYRIMNTIGQQQGIERVRIFNKEGRVTFSTDAQEVNTFVDKKAESCYACHAANQPIVRLTIPSRSRTYQRGDHRVLGMVTMLQQGCAFRRGTSVGGTGDMKSTSPASSAAMRVAASLMGVNRMRPTLPGESLSQ